MESLNMKLRPPSPQHSRACKHATHRILYIYPAPGKYARNCRRCFFEVDGVSVPPKRLAAPGCSSTRSVPAQMLLLRQPKADAKDAHRSRCCCCSLSTEPYACLSADHCSSGSGFSVIRRSLVISKLSQLLAILGATFSKFGVIPLYNPFSPS